MRRIIYTLLVCLLTSIMTSAATYTLTVTVSPEQGGSCSSGGTREEGKQVYIYINSNTGYRFLGCYEGETLVSDKTSFYYTMPSHDVTLTARFEYDPDVPADPAVKYTVQVKARPEGGGSFYNDKVTAEEGSRIRLYAYTNTGYRFVRWENETGRRLSAQQDFYYTMPNANATIYGIFDYDPAPPANPGANSWNAQTGEVIVDDFTPGQLSDAISAAIKGSDRGEVLKIVVMGEMSKYDFGFANDYSNCNELDLSQVTGLKEIPSWSLDDTSMERISLPDGIEEIGSYAFDGCQNLTTLTILTTTPPTLGRNVFSDVHAEMVVYVPVYALDAYEKAEGWKDLNIKPMQDGVRNVTVSLPQGARAADYANMWIELSNAQASKPLRFLMTGNSCTCNAIPRNSTWDVTMKNAYGDVLGSIKGVAVANDDVSVTFASLIQPQVVTLEVRDLDGAYLTSKARISWYLPDGTFIAQGPQLKGMVAGKKLCYDIDLGEELGVKYRETQRATYTVTEQLNSINVRLQKIPEVTLAVKVKGDYNSTVGGANVTVAQWMNSRYMTTRTVTTDNKGSVLVLAYADSARVTVAASGYEDTVIVRSTFTQTDKTQKEELNVVLKRLRGRSVAVVAHALTIDGDTRWLDMEDLQLSLRNKTTGRDITDIAISGSDVYVKGGAQAGDVVELTATHRRDEYAAATTTVTLADDEMATATVTLTERGSAWISFDSSGNVENRAFLFDTDGNMVGKTRFARTTAKFSHMPPATYTFVAMGATDMFAPTNIADFAAAHLRADEDFATGTVTVSDGQIAKATVQRIPKLDEQTFNYTSGDTYVQVNKTAVTAGSYVTLSSRIYFKEEYAGRVQNVQLVLTLPDGCDLVENSVILGTQLTSYTLIGRQVIITLPDDNTEERIRLCLMPLKGGQQNVAAAVNFDLDGQQTQAIGSAMFHVSDLSLRTPNSKVNTPTVLLSGKAQANASVAVYDNGQLIGETKTLGNGTWNERFTLKNAFNLSRHTLYAKITTAAGKEMQTQAQTVEYDRTAVEAHGVTMTFYNGWLKRNVSVYFNLHDGTASPESYQFYHETVITFITHLSNPDPSIVKAVRLRVYTNNNSSRILSATYDEGLKTWVASGTFGTKSLPIGVSLVMDYDNTPVYDREFNDDYFSKLSEDLMSTDDDTEREEADGSLSEDFDYWEQRLRAAQSTEEYESIIKEFIEEMDKEYGQYLTELDTTFMTYDIPAQQLDDGTMMPAISYVRANSGNILQQLPAGLWEITDDGENGTFIMTNENGDKLIMHLPEASAEGRRAMMRKLFGSGLMDKATSLLRGGLASLEDQCNKYIYDLDRMTTEMAKKYPTLPYGKKPLDKNLLSEISKKIKNAQLIGKLVRGCIGIINVFNIFQLKEQYDKGKDTENQWDHLMESVENCKGMNRTQAEYANTIKEKIDDQREKIERWNTAKLNANILTKTVQIAGVAGAVESLGASLLISLIGLGVDCGFDWYDKKMQEENRRIYRQVLQMKESLPCDDDDDDDDDDPDPEPPLPSTTPILDPSGYVFEAVTSNRLQGVTATLFHKVAEEDMYGDMHDVVKKWDAEAYGQVNPQTTDADGHYAWDVPNGLWQVKYEKEGYETAYSEWLPVPPPQIDVNVELRQNVQPTVKAAHAYDDAVEIELDKYMLAALLTEKNIRVSIGGTDVSGTVRLLNEETGTTADGLSQQLASKVRWQAEKAFNANTVTLSVSNSVKSYTGQQMSADYSQTLYVEHEVKAIDCDSIVTIAYGAERAIIVKALPAEATAGKRLTVDNSSSLVIGTDDTAINLDSEGKAVVAVKGKLPGMAALHFAIDGTAVTATTLVSVRTYMPGDINHDGIVDVADIASIISQMAGCNCHNASEVDVNGDGILDVADIAAIITIMAH